MGTDGKNGICCSKRRNLIPSERGEINGFYVKTVERKRETAQVWDRQSERNRKRLSTLWFNGPESRAQRQTGKQLACLSLRCHASVPLSLFATCPAYLMPPWHFATAFGWHHQSERRWGVTPDWQWRDGKLSSAICFCPSKPQVITATSFFLII